MKLFELIPLTRGLFTIIDAEDYKLVNKYKWCALKAERKYGIFYYAVSGSGPMIYMHRLILNLGSDDPQVDHKDGNGLNNRKTNLRLVTYDQNAANSIITQPHSSIYRGVSWDKNRQRWQVQAGGGKDRKCLGYFMDEEEAARAYDTAALEKWGEFAKLNFPERDR